VTAADRFRTLGLTSSCHGQNRAWRDQRV